jgi:DNA-binding MarR family transcriptional regulator
MDNGATQDDGGRPLMSTDDYQALAAFRYALRQFLRFSEEAARRAGVTPQQYLAMIAVRGFPGRDRLTVSELAERLQIRHHSAVELSGRLEKRGWIRRSRRGADRREVQLKLTPRAERLLAKLSVTHRNELRSAETRLIRALSRAAARRRRHR